MSPAEYQKEVSYELVTGKVDSLGAFFSTLCPGRHGMGQVHIHNLFFGWKETQSRGYPKAPFPYCFLDLGIQESLDTVQQNFWLFAKH